MEERGGRQGAAHSSQKRLPVGGEGDVPTASRDNSAEMLYPCEVKKKVFRIKSKAKRKKGRGAKGGSQREGFLCLDWSER